MLSYFCMTNKESDKESAAKARVLYKKNIFLLLLSTALIGVLSASVYFFGLYGKILPNVYINSTPVGGLRPEEAFNVIRNQIVLPNDIAVKISSPERPIDFTIPTSAIEATIDYEKTYQNAYKLGRSGSKRQDAKTITHLLNDSLVIRPVVVVNEELLNEQIAIISSQVPNPPQDTGLIVKGQEIYLKPGQKGYYVDTEMLKADILNTLQSANSKITIFPIEKNPALTEPEAQAFLAKASSLFQKTIVLTFEEVEFAYEGVQMLNFLVPRGGYRFDKISPSLEEVGAALERSPQNPVFKYEAGRVQEFSAAKEGLKVDTEALQNKMATSLDELLEGGLDSISIDIPVQRTPSDFSTADVNDLGIKEIIGVGSSTFRGSISSRVYNVAHAAAKLNGVLIKPGETFSFVSTLGDISALTGYKQAYVIQGNQTVLGDGGGVCQVSTTFFRAALDAGLPIVERHAHSYRVGYYEQDSGPGIDATIYHPTVDIKIKNDTPGHILIQTSTDTKNMTLKFEFYGTSDGRLSTIGKPKISSSTPPPEDLYIDDPTLPAGVVKQIDYKAWGAKVNFDYKVERNGELIYEDTFYSNYRPWQAKFLRGTGPAVAN